MKRPWITFFSQTGSEIARLTAMRNCRPDVVITNRSDLEGVDYFLKQEIEKGLKIEYIPNKPSVADYKKILKKYKKPLITLHGYLRIIPAEFCNKYEIYNLHPGLITEYPELKGKDPQKRAIEGGYPMAGCVLHKVIPQVDEGEIISSYKMAIPDFTVDRLIGDLKMASLILWKDFFTSYDK
jgi:folate-dependent phosphoribosylglycinamide formyltransferase PurN